MAENVRPPVAVRIVRPYDTEDALLENELETIGKTSVLLIGAHPRPTGVILRFEVTLATGATVLRGEGRVLAHKENAFRGQAGLALRFTRLDPRSKAVVDRATAIREQRAQIDAPAPMPESTPSLETSAPAPAPAAAPEEGAITAALTQPTPTPAPAAPEPRPMRPSNRPTRQFQAVRPDLTPPPSPVATAAPAFAPEPPTSAASVAPRSLAQLRASIEPPAPVVTADDVPKLADEAMVEAGAAKATIAPRQTTPTLAAPGPTQSKRAPRRSTHSGAAPNATAPLAPPPDRDALLARLRERATGLSADRVGEILASARANDANDASA